MTGENSIMNNMDLPIQNPMNLFQDVMGWLKTAGVKQAGTKEQFNLVKTLILEELDELEVAVNNNDPVEQTDAVVDLLWVTLNWAYMNSLNIEPYADRVSYSNWSKFCTTEEEADRTVDAYIRGVHPSKPGAKIECYRVQSGQYWIVKRLSDDKILKSLNFMEP